jgi:uncharacterized protein
VNAPRETVDLIGLLERGDGENVVIASFEIGFQVAGHFSEGARVLECFLIVRLQNFLALELAVRQTEVFGLLGCGREGVFRGALLRRHGEGGREKDCDSKGMGGNHDDTASFIIGQEFSRAADFGLFYDLGMPARERFQPGEFCWVEVATSNQMAAKSFYSALFNWTAQDVPIGPNAIYSLMQLDGRVAAGLYTMQDEERNAGVPPHWNLYVAVESADEAAKKAAGLGAKVMDAPFEVGDRGRAAVFLDPTGALFQVWQPNQRSGLGVTGEPGSFCWADLNSTDQARAKTFYEGLFGWKLLPGQEKESGGYLHIVNGEKYIGGVPPAREHGGGPSHWLIYFAVANVDEAFHRALDMKARTLLRPMDFEGVGRVGLLADPQGAVFALFREAGK